MYPNLICRCFCERKINVQRARLYNCMQNMALREQRAPFIYIALCIIVIIVIVSRII